ncbi:MAG: esterase-like activity of phytase family protein [Cyclobacteriaceae bacterium]|nr:esterase-like activity of phytase family protein [Cyclobacteriaceae bacterium]
MYYIFCFLPFLMIFNCSDKKEPIQVSKFRLIGEQQLDVATTFQGTQVGGISGIDMNPDGTFYLLSDDGSEINPARFYTAELNYDASIFSSINLKTVVSLKTPAGNNYPSYNDYFGSSTTINYTDPESIRYDPFTGTLLYASEGSDLNINIAPVQPFIHQIDLQGTFIKEIPTPSQFRYVRPPNTTGLITNATFESMCLIPNSDDLWVAIEAPLLQDGPRATFSQGGSPIRIARVNWKTNTQVAQYAYIPEKNPKNPIPANGSSNNGVCEVLSIDENRLLVLERAFSAGYPTATGNTIRIYEVDFSGATDVSNVTSLVNASYKPLVKTLVLDFSNIGIRDTDNIETFAWGKTLPNGNRTMVFVTDNNFSATQIFKFYVFEITNL